MHLLGVEEFLKKVPVGLFSLRRSGVVQLDSAHPVSVNSRPEVWGFQLYTAVCDGGELAAEGISVSHRGVLGHYGIRASPHLYNTKDDVETFIEALFGAIGE